MDELVLDGKTYLSSKKAAKVTGYAKDYIGQLCREGRVDSKLVGRSWYVYEPSIREHRFNDERSKAKKKQANTGDNSPALVEKPEESNPLESIWEQPAYTPETFETLPPLEEAVATTEAYKEEPKTVGDMQAAWQDWFATQNQPTPATAAIEEQEPYIREEEPYKAPQETESVPMRMIVSDIAPKREERRQVPAYTPVQEHYQSEEPVQRRHKSKPKGSTVVVKALFGALIVFAGSIMLIATGLIDDLHLTGLTDTPVLQYLQGSTVVEK